MIDFLTMGIPEGFMLLVLILFSYIDLKNQTFPAPLTTSVLFFVALVNSANMIFGILSLIFALFLLEMQFFSGMADLKILVAIGLFISSLNAFFIYILLIMIYGTVYKMVAYYLMKKRGYIPFIPVYLLVYITLLITHLV